MKNQNYMDEVIDLFKQATALNGSLTFEDYRKLRILFARNGYEPRTLAVLRTSISRRQLREFVSPMPFCTPDHMQGNIILGQNSGVASRYSSEFATYHFLGVGQTGMGKSVMMTFLILQYMLIAGGIWVFDFVKRELRGIKRLAEQAGCNFHVCRFEQLRINILDPQGTDPFLFPNVCAEFLTLALGMPPVAKLILKICITVLYERFGLFVNPAAQRPVIEDLIEEVRKFEGNKSAKDAILIRLQALMANNKQVFGVRRGMPVAKLAQKLIIWEIDGVEAVYQNLIVSYLIAVLFLLRVQNKSNELVIVSFDEASGIYSKAAESTNEGPSYITKMTCTVRKMLIGIIAFTQTCSDLSNSIIANSGIKSLSQVGSFQDYEYMGKAMGLTSEQLQWARTGGLSIGTQIIKMNFGWQKPFINKTPLIRIPEDVTDTEVRQSAEELLKLVPQPSKNIICLPANNEPQEPVNRDDALSDDEKILYEEVVSNPDEPSTVIHYQNAGLTTKRGNAAKKTLVDKGILKEILTETGNRGGKQSFLEIIDSGNGRTGNHLHKYLCRQIGHWHEKQSCQVEHERTFVIDDKRFFTDIAITWPDGKTEAIEVETEDNPRVIGNIRKNLQACFSCVSVVTPNNNVRTAVIIHVKREFGSDLPDTIRFPRMCFYK